MSNNGHADPCSRLWTKRERAFAGKDTPMTTRQILARILIAPGIWREGDRLVATARVGSSRATDQQRARETFPLGTSVAEMKAWQHDAKSALLRAQPEMPAGGTLAADFDAYLADLPDNGYKRDTRSILAHWKATPLAAIPRAEVARADVIAQLNRWVDTGTPASTRNKRLSRLRKVYEHFDKVATPNPTDKITFLRDYTEEPRDIPMHVVKQILASLPDLGRAEKGQTRPTRSMTKLALSVIAWTGMMPATLKRMTARHFKELARSRAFFTPRRKGKGSDAAWVPLLPEAVDALRAFQDAGLIGHTFSASSMGKTWRVGIKRATASARRHAELTGDRSWLDELDTLPPNCRPQDLRHSFATKAYDETGDIRAVAALLQHASMETTKRYTKGAVDARSLAAIAKVRDAFANLPTIPTPPPAATPASAKLRRSALRIVRKSVAS